MHDSSFGRLIGVLVAPGKTFRSIAERPTWVVPLVVLVLLLTSFTFLMLQRVDFMEAMREQMAAQGRPVPAGMDKAGGFMLGCQTAVVFLGSTALYFAGAGFFLLFNLFGGRLRYKTSLSVLLHAMMPFALSCVLAVPIVLSRESISLEEVRGGGGLLPSNLAVLAPEDAGPRLLALLSSVDFFTIWVLILLTIGYSIAARVSRTTAAVTVVLLWAVLVLAKVGLAGLGPMGGMR
jgi:hypothetical protein